MTPADGGTVPTRSSVASRRAVRTAPVLAVLVCHDGERWLPATLAALRTLTVRPRHVLAVDTGSTDRTPELLEAAGEVLDGVLTLPRDTAYGAAVQAAVEHGEERWGDPGSWVWLLHDDCAPEPDCLAALLTVAEMSPSAGLLGPLCLDWSDPRVVVEAGLSIDASGHRQTGIGAVELDLGQFRQNAEVLAVSSAGALVRREVWSALAGYDPALPMLHDDLDFGWRVNQADHLVLCVPAARLRHARAAATGQRPLDAVDAQWHRSGQPRAVDRGHGLRTFLVNCSTSSFVLGLPRISVLSLTRAVGFLLLRRIGPARAELAALGYLLSGRARLLAARRDRRGLSVRRGRSVRGLLTSRFTRLRNGVRGAVAALMRHQVRADAALGQLPATPVEPEPPPTRVRAVGPAALPAGVLPARRPAEGSTRRTAGLRRPQRTLVVPVQEAVPGIPSTVLRPSPVPRDGAVPAGPAGGRLLMVDIDVRKMLRTVLLAPPVLMMAAVLIVSLLVQRGRLGLDLAGGRLLPLPELGATWASYLAEWHAVAGGTAAPSPVALTVVGVLGAPVGSPATAVSLLLLIAPALAALSAYLASRPLEVPRWARALAAAGYGLLPAGTAAVAQGRLGVVVAHVLLPLVLAGVVALVRGGGFDRLAGGWFTAACATALGLSVISAFTPVLHLLVLVVALIGFVLWPAPGQRALRRVAGLFLVVLLPLGVLLPWPAVVVQHPEVLLHGVGATVAEPTVGPVQLAALDPGGPGASPWAGAALVAVAGLAVALRPHRLAIPGLGVAVLGMGTAAVLGTRSMVPLTGGAARPGWTGAALLFAACGLLWVALVACTKRPSDSPRPPGPSPRATAVAGGVGVGVLAASALVYGSAGPLTAEPGELAAPVAAELARTRTAVLVVGSPDDPVRMSAGRLPRFGDDDLAPVPTVPARLEGLAARLRSDRPNLVRSAIADASVSGVQFVVLPTGADAARLIAAAEPLAASAPAMSDGRPVVRLLRLASPAVLLGPQLATAARTGGDPPAVPGTTGGLPVPATLPDVAVQIAGGADGRLLVLAAEDEPGWRATVGGRPAATVRAWGHLVAVPVRGNATEVRVQRPTAVRLALLLAQGAVVLFVVFTALPSPRRAAREDTVPGPVLPKLTRSAK